jgi:hypothetical protein
MSGFARGPHLTWPVRLVVLATLTVVAACSDTDRPAPSPTQPVDLAKTTSGPCNDALATTIGDEITALLPTQQANNARTLFKAVATACPTDKVTAAKNAVAYYKYFLDQLYANPSLVLQPAGTPAALKTHFNNIAAFVAQEPQFRESMFAKGTETNPSYGTDGGALKVCNVGTADTPLCQIITKNSIAGIAVPPSALLSTYPAYVFAIGLVSNAECGSLVIDAQKYSENLKFKPPCYDAVVFPQYQNPDQFNTPSSLVQTTFKSPWVTLAVCPLEQFNTTAEIDFSKYRLAIPALNPPFDEVKYHPVKLGPYALDIVDPNTQSDLATALSAFLYGTAADKHGGMSVNCAASADVASITNYPQGPVGVAVAWLDRLASRAAALVGPKPLYAGHLTTSGTYKSLPKSPVGNVDSRTFFATFLSPPEGPYSPGFTFPTIPPAGSSPADVGFWTTAQATAPGSITIQAALGDPTLGLNSRPVVLSQGGGACDKSCGQLLLEGTVTGPRARTGIYLVTWESVENKPTVKFAPFDVRDSTGKVLARISYSTEMSNRVLRYNATKAGTGTLIGNWTVGVKQTFVITVNLNTKRTSVSINGVPFKDPGATDPKLFPYLNTTAQDLYHVTADFSGIDAGTVAWDNIEVLRLPDHPADQ